ncbi:MAG: hypothetical protein WAU82_15420 [Candidatus Binatus sp.]|uniref:hypothetical protein n=1 Tax=Candidatus Binatus sp. TaxID=2811406 RepID=UPI003BB10211
MRRAVLVVVAIWCCGLAGCFEWTEDPHGNLQSVGLPGLPVWKSKTPPAPMTPAEMGYTPEEASKMGGPILVEPPNGSVKMYRYRYYQTGQNNCQQDLQKMLAERAASNATGAAPYCADSSGAPLASSASASSPSASSPSASAPPPAPTAKGNEFVF